MLGYSVLSTIHSDNISDVLKHIHDPLIRPTEGYWAGLIVELAHTDPNRLLL
jgi:hypothetical protein